MDPKRTKKQSQPKQKVQSKGQTLQNAPISYFIKDPTMLEILKNKNIVKLLPIQFETFPIIYEGQDIVAKDRTGSGKTLAYTLPIITRMRERQQFRGEPFIKFMILVPTRQLAIQVTDQIKSIRYKNRDDFLIAAVYGGTRIYQHIQILRKGADIIVGTPGRIIDLLQRKAMRLYNLQIICLDQADEMLNIGFKAEIQKIFLYIKAAKKQKVQCLMFSATIPQWIWKMSSLYQQKNTKFINMIKQGNIQTSKTVEHFCLGLNNNQKQFYIGSVIQYFLGNKTGKIIVFCQTKKEVDRIGNSGMIGTSVAMLHGDYTQQQREKVYRDFKFGKLQCLIATNVAARGLDFPQIDLIIQMQPPATTDAYIHRSGRTGRAGKSGICVTMYSYKQQMYMQRIEQQAKLKFKHINPNQLEPQCPNKIKFNPYSNNYQQQSTGYNNYNKNYNNYNSYKNQNYNYQTNNKYNQNNEQQYWGEQSSITNKRY